ncbi:MAG: hypothetical protein ACE5JS_16640 [Nitrospinota bacterium]
MRKLTFIFLAFFTAFLFAGGAAGQQMKGMQPCAPMKTPMKGMQPCAAKKMPMMEMGKVPNPDLLISTFEKQAVLPDEALAFGPTGMGENFFAKLIAKVDFGNGVWFSVRKARIPKGGNVGIMSTTEICYIERGLGLIMDEKGEMVKAVPAGSWFTVPTDWRHTLKSIGEEDLIMTVIRVGPKSIH